MQKKWWTVLTVIVIFIISFIGCQKVNVEDRITRIETGLIKAVLIEGQETVKMTIADRMERYKVPGLSIAVINDNKIEWAKGYGVLEVESDKPVNTETLFQAASISKPVAAMAALYFADQGVLSLDEEVNDRLTSWKIPASEFTQSESVTLRRLLSHTAGTTVHGFGGYPADATVPTLVQLLNGEKPANSAPIVVDIAPNSRFRYSGGGYCIAQQLLIDIEEKAFPQIAQEKVLAPLGMSLSTYEQPLPENRRINAATAHKTSGEPIQGKYHTYPEMAAAGLWTTPSDLARFAIDISNTFDGKSETVLSRDMIIEMLTVQHGNYGLGLSIGGSDRDFGFGHGGSNAGFRCFMTHYAKRGQGVVIMTNGDQGSSLYNEILRSMAVEYGWPDFAPKVKAVSAVTPEILKQYVGEYELFPGFTITVTAEEGRLFVKAQAEDKAEAHPASETKFFLTDDNIEFDFIINDRGEIPGVNILIWGDTRVAKKIK